MAAILRFYNLGQTPVALDWDEASLGWNAYSILKTGTDEYGKFLPVSIRSFNDYKPPLYVYAAIPGIAIFGLNEFSTRLPSAIAGVLLVVATFYLCRSLKMPPTNSFLAAFLVAISPWSIQFSRAAFEANLAIFFFVLGATFLSLFINKDRGWFIVPAFFAFALSIYSYHSSRLMVPVFLAGIGIWYRAVFFKHWKVFVFSSVLFLLLMYPLVRNSRNVGSLQARFETVSVLNSKEVKENKLNIFPVVGRNYLSHFNFDFLFLTADGNMRHHIPDMGLLYLAEFPFLLAGIYFIIKEKPKWAPFVGFWFFLAPAASSVTATAPHAIRSLIILPTFQIFTALGIARLFKNIRWVKFIVPLFFGINIFFYLHQYFIHFPVEYARNWQYGYKEVVAEVLAREKDYDQIYISTYYDQPYIYFLFFGRVDPKVKNNSLFFKSFDKYYFLIEAIDRKGLYVLAPHEDRAGLRVIKTINFPNGTPAFVLADKVKT